MDSFLFAALYILFLVLAALAAAKMIYQRRVRAREIREEIEHDRLVMAINYQLMDAESEDLIPTK